MQKPKNPCCQVVLNQMRDIPEKFILDNGGRCTHCKTWYDLEEREIPQVRMPIKIMQELANV
jgi:hypothetical protein